MTVIYLSNNRIQLVSGDGGKTGAAVKGCLTYENVSPFFFNGEITDADAFCAKLNELFADGRFSKRGVTLVLNTSQIIYRAITTPVLNKAGTLKYVSNEFADVERTNTPAFAYMQLGGSSKKNLARLLAMEVEDNYIRTIMQLLSRCGISVSAVQYFTAAGIRAIRGFKLEGATSIVQVMESNGFSSMLFSGGAYLYSTYSRLSFPHGTPEFGSEVARSVSSIMQFAKAQHVSDTISNVYFAGFSDNDIVYAAEAIERMGGGIGTQKLGESSNIKIKYEGIAVSDCLFAAGGLLTDQTSDFLCSMPKNPTKNEKLIKLLKVIIPLALLVAILTAASVWLTIVRVSKAAKLAAINDYNNSEEVAAQLAYAEALKSANEQVNTRIKNVGESLEIMATYPLPNTSVVNKLAECAGTLASVEVVSYDSESGQLQFTAFAAEVDNIYKFIDRLAAEDEFAAISYSGYELNVTSGLWAVNVTVCLSPEAGRGS